MTPAAVWRIDDERYSDSLTEKGASADTVMGMLLSV